MKQPYRNWINYNTVSVTMGGAGATLKFAENIANLYNLTEAISGADGQKPRLNSIFYHFRCYSVHEFSLMPIVVQTAGTWTDTVDINQFVLSIVLDGTIDDVFGFQKLCKVSKVAKRIPTDVQGSDTGTKYALEFTIEIPGNILQILNKETETERLQDLYMGFVGQCANNGQVVEIHYFNDVEYITTSKKIILR